MMHIERSWRFGFGVLLSAALALSCGNVRRDHAGPSGSAGSSGSTANTGGLGDPPDDGGASNAGAGEAAGLGADAGSGAGAGAGATAPSFEPGSVSMRLLTSAQYQNSISDLLAVSTPAPTVTASTPTDSVEISDLAPYFDVATRVTESAFAAPALPALLRCDAALSGRDCALGIIETFGSRVFRKPLLAEQKAAFSKLYDAVIAGGDTPTVALKQVVRGLLVSLQFVYRVEFTGQSPTNEPYLLDSYAMAARLSYLLWNTTPDAALADAAAQDQLTGDAGLSAQFDRLAGAGKTSAFALDFGTEWLGLDALAQVGTPTSLELRQEVALYLATFFDQDLPFNQVLSRDLNFTDRTLYGFYSPYTSPPLTLTDTLTPVSVTDDARRGLLGLGGVLIAMSPPSRVSIPHRGEYVQEKFLCRTDLTAPAGSPIVGASYERKDLEAALPTSPACQSCHGVLDPIGEALDHFDYNGSYRAHYPSNDEIDSTATLSTGEKITDEISLSDALSQQKEFRSCLARQLATFGLERPLTDTDAPYLTTMTDQVATGVGLRGLFKRVALSSPFRYRRPAPQ